MSYFVTPFDIRSTIFDIRVHSMQKSCANPWCQQSFEVTDADIAFYEKVSPVFNGKKELIPPPTLCPECRSRRRLSYRSSRNLYKRTCSATGKSMISIFPEHTKFPVLSYDEWWSDRNDALSSGIDFNATQSLLEQYSRVVEHTAHINLQNAGNENSEYTSYAGWNKNCYLIYYSDFNQDCCYLQDSFHCKNSYDCTCSHRSTACYNCFFCTNCYNCHNALSSSDCADCQYIRDCIGCQHCFGCANLRHKKYCIFNEQYSIQEYERIVQSFDLHTSSGRARAEQAAKDCSMRLPWKFYRGISNDNVEGTSLISVKMSTKVS